MYITKGEKALIKNMQRSRRKFHGGPKELKALGRPLKKYQGVRVGGKLITSYAQVKPKHPSKTTTKQKVGQGIGIAIL